MAVGISSTAPRSLLIQCMMMAPAGCDRARILEPHAQLNRFAGVRAIAETKRADLALGAESDERIFVWQRPILSPPADLPRLRALRARGYAIVVEYDDDPRRRKEHLANDFFTFRACHAVQTSTPALAELLRAFNPHVLVFENQIADLPPPPGPGSNEETRIFFGAINRGPDWRPLLPALNRVASRWGERLSWEVVHDREFHDALVATRKRFTPFCPYERYREILRSCDVALLPLAPTSFNRMKSDLKFIEAAAEGAVALASPVVYADSIADGVTGRIFRSPEEFETRLVELISGPAHRARIASRAYEYVRRERQLENHIQQRLTAYFDLRNNLSRLDADLLTRVPELARP